MWGEGWRGGWVYVGLEGVIDLIFRVVWFVRVGVKREGREVLEE